MGKNGHLKIIGRKKNLVKTFNGEYIALGKVSFQFLGTTRVSSDADLVLVGICLPRLLAGGQFCVYADQNKTKPVALIVPVEGPLKKLTAETDAEGRPEELVHDDKAAVLIGNCDI